MRYLTNVFLMSLLFSLVVAQETEPRDLDSFTLTITAELFEKNQEAAELFVQANDARVQERLQDAELLYRKVLELVPDFYHATRRLASVVIKLGKYGEALQLAREALEAKETVPNLYMLLYVMINPEVESEPSGAALSEAVELARRILSEPDVDGELLPLVCQTAVMADDIWLLRTCSHRLAEVSPDEIYTHYFSWLIAVSEGEYEAAVSALERAREAGLPKANYDSMVEATEEVRPVSSEYLALAGRVFAFWLAGLGMLLVLGLIMSQFVMRAASKLPLVQTGESVGSDALLRGFYRVVLWLSSIYYFLSIPLVVFAVLILGGAILYAFLEVGRIPIKLVAIVGLVVLATVWSGLKGLFSILSQPDEEAPGERLEVSQHKGLVEVLEEVASVIGTRPVDNVYLTPGTEMAVMERGGLWRQLRGTTERCLILGAAVLDDFRIGPFKAVLAHEYGHFCNKDTAGGGFVIGVRRSLDTMARSLAENGAATWYSPAWLFLCGFSRVFLVVSQGASRLQEVMADRWAAFAYGARNFEEGLRHVIEATIRFDAHSQATLTEVVEGQKPLNNIYSYQPEDRPGEDQIQKHFEESLHAQPSVYDSHPSPVDRITWVRRLEVNREGSQDGGEGDAWDLFLDRLAIEKAMTAQVRGSVARHYGVILVDDGSDDPELPATETLSESEKKELREAYAQMSGERLTQLGKEPGLRLESEEILKEELSRRVAAEA